MALDELELRRGFGHFPTGVTVVSFEDDGRAWGLTASSFVSLSLRPPLVRSEEHTSELQSPC